IRLSTKCVGYSIFLEAMMQPLRPSPSLPGVIGVTIGDECTKLPLFFSLNRHGLEMSTTCGWAVSVSECGIRRGSGGRKAMDEVRHPGEVGVVFKPEAELMNASAFTCGLALAVCLTRLGCQRRSSFLRNQSESLNGGLARTK